MDASISHYRNRTDLIDLSIVPLSTGLEWPILSSRKIAPGPFFWEVNQQPITLIDWMDQMTFFPIALIKISGKS